MVHPGECVADVDGNIAGEGTPFLLVVLLVLV